MLLFVVLFFSVYVFKETRRGSYVFPELGTKTVPTFSVQAAHKRCLVGEGLFLPPFYMVGGGDLKSSVSAKTLNDPVWGKRDREQKDLIPLYMGEELNAAVGVFKAHLGKTPLLWSAEKISMAAAGSPLTCGENPSMLMARGILSFMSRVCCIFCNRSPVWYMMRKPLLQRRIVVRPMFLHGRLALSFQSSLSAVITCLLKFAMRIWPLLVWERFCVNIGAPFREGRMIFSRF